MGKDKLRKWAEMKDWEHVIEPPMSDIINKDFRFKGKWAKEHFGNDKPIVLELGCGKGEYTLGMAKEFPGKSFVGVDIKGARIWKGAKTALEEGVGNASFLRTRIEFIDSFFGKDEVDEIWITFPDPQLKKKRAKKRLSGSRFLESYRKFLKPGGIVHLKTDNAFLHHYTKVLLEYNELPILFASDDIYSSSLPDPLLEIKTHYEKSFLEENMKITYIKFCIDGSTPLKELPEEEAETE